MAPAKSYKVLVCGEVVFRGSWRSASVVYDSVLKALNIASSSSLPAVVLAFDI